MKYTLSKSDFKVASTCLKKLKYKKLGYPSSMADNDFMKMLAEGGYVIGKMAQMLYPGTLITGATADAVKQTQELLQQKTVVLHEAAIQAGQKVIRIDILKKDGNNFHIIEVKAKSYTGDDKNKEQKDLLEYARDAIFQRMVLEEAYPKAKVKASLLLPDKTKRTSIEGLAGWFKTSVSTGVDNFRKVEVSCIYENTPAFEEKRQLLIKDDLLYLFDLSELTKENFSNIQESTGRMLELLNNGFEYTSDDYAISKACKGCEFRANAPGEPDGYKECWGHLADVAPHIFDIYYGGTLGENMLLDELIKQKKVSLWDLNETHFVKKDGNVGSRNERQIIQYTNTKAGQEWLSDDLIPEMEEWKFPLHFIDFETYTGAVPHHKGMRPYELVAFQWSCHTITHPGAEPVHQEWINTEDDFPNFRFAESLMEHIGNKGTPLMWATHENTVLRKVLEQMDVYSYVNNELKDWLTSITRDKDKGRKGRLVDMNALTLKHYFHPYMKGRTSIKKTLPAVWNHNPYLHQVEWFKPYVLHGDTGLIQDPYRTLKMKFATDFMGFSPTDADIEEAEEVVSDGGAAMKAYHDIVFGDAATKMKLKQQLLEYCKLDTMAMVIIYHHWLYGQKN